MSQLGRDKIDRAYVWFANAVAAEDLSYPNHAGRLKVARDMLSEVPVFDKFVVRSMVNQGYTFETDQTTINDYLSSLSDTLVKLEFAGATGNISEMTTNLNEIHGKLGWHNQEIIAQGWRRPLDLLVFYGFPNSFNSSSNGWLNERVAQDMSKYGVIVFGAGLEDSSHGDFSNTTIIVARIKQLNPSTLIFGYVDGALGQSTFETKAGKWQANHGVHGIFCDQFGYDYGNTRAQQNAKLDYLHGHGLIAFVNSWNADHVLGTTDDVSYPNSTYNLLLSASKLTEDDWVMLESLAVNTDSFGSNNGYASKDDWIARVSKALSLRAVYGVNFASIGIIDNANVAGQALADFAFVSSAMSCLDAHGTSDTSYASSSSAVTFWARPDVSMMGLYWSLNPAIHVDAIDADVYFRQVQFGRFKLDFSAGEQTSSKVERSAGEQTSSKVELSSGAQTSSVEHRDWRKLLGSVSISNSVNETNVVDVTVPGGTVWVNGDALRLVASGRYFNNSGSNRSFTVRVKVDGITVYADSSGNIATGTTNRGVRLVLDIIRISSTTAEIVGDLLVGSSAVGATGRSDLGATAVRSSPIISTAGINWTFANATRLVVSIQLSNAEATSEFGLYSGTIR